MQPRPNKQWLLWSSKYAVKPRSSVMDHNLQNRQRIDEVPSLVRFTRCWYQRREHGAVAALQLAHTRLREGWILHCWYVFCTFRQDDRCSAADLRPERFLRSRLTWTPKNQVCILNIDIVLIIILWNINVTILWTGRSDLDRRALPNKNQIK